VAVPPREPSLGRYSVRPASSTTREFKSPVGASMTRRNTDKMPAHVDETPCSGAVRASSASSPSAVPRRLPPPGAIEEAPLGSREAFVLSLVDGEASLASLGDVSGLGETELRAIVDRLAALKLIALG
jgi:hypothetical protein